MTPHEQRGDEDEGSPPRGGANPGRKCRGKIERSAEALRGRHAPISFPPVHKPRTTLWGNPAGKDVVMAKK